MFVVVCAFQKRCGTGLVNHVPIQVILNHAIHDSLDMECMSLVDVNLVKVPKLGM